tara:strand:- start:91 stop:372 length:282 start_codon:yes stop_codon:yes gene_type:complete
MLLVDHTSLSRKDAQAVKMLLSVYADNFAGEGFYIAKVERSGNVFMSFDHTAVSPFVTPDGSLFYEVFNFETGETFETNSLNDANYDENIPIG